MKISKSWLQEWVDVSLTGQHLAEQLTMAGLEVAGIEPAAPAFSGVVVGEILHQEPHPDADRLSVVTVNNGSATPLTIVCGAGNARPGLKTAVAVDGAILPAMTIQGRQQRGVESQGMLCSAADLGLADSADGLLELPPASPVGTDLRQLLNLDDAVIEVDLTPNRGDCLSIQGIARELAAIHDVSLRESFHPPADSTLADQLDIDLQAKQHCSRYVGRIIRNVDNTVPTPLWMTEKLRRAGIRSLGIVVDITNYVMLELGQPMHAFDLDKVDGGIRVRMAEAGETLALLNGNTITLNRDSLVIADHTRALALAGIMGGQESAVTDQSSNIFLESAFFNPEKMAGKARRYGLHTDSSHRFERGVDPQLQQRAMERAAALILDIAGGQAGPILEACAENQLPGPATLSLNVGDTNQRLGIELPGKTMQAILQRLGMTVTRTAEGRLQVTPPSYRFDIAIEADLVEEIARLHGYNNIPARHQPSTPATTRPQPSLMPLRQCLLQRGYRETINYSFIDSTSQQQFSPNIDSIALSNPISSDLSVMRGNLWPSLLKTLVYNHNRQQQRIRLFEIGRCFRYQANKTIDQPMQIAAIATGPVQPLQWASAERNVDFFDIKADLESLLTVAGQNARFIPDNHPALHPGQCAAIEIDGEIIGHLGALHPKIAADWSISEPVYLFQCRLSALLTPPLRHFQELPRFPESHRDIAILVNRETPVDDITATIRQHGGDLLKSVCLFDVYQGQNVPAKQKSLAFRLTLQDSRENLTDRRIDQTMATIINALEQQFTATLRA